MAGLEPVPGSTLVPGPAWTKLEILDIEGDPVRELLALELPAGSREVMWDSQDDQGENVPSGINFVHLLLWDDLAEDPRFVASRTILDRARDRPDHALQRRRGRRGGDHPVLHLGPAQPEGKAMSDRPWIMMNLPATLVWLRSGTS